MVSGSFRRHIVRVIQAVSHPAPDDDRSTDGRRAINKSNLWLEITFARLGELLDSFEQQCCLTVAILSAHICNNTIWNNRIVFGLPLIFDKSCHRAYRTYLDNQL